MASRPPAFVLVHGGAHTSECWDLTVAALHRLHPQASVFAPNLPGRRGVAGDLGSLTIDDCVRSLCDQILENVAQSQRIVLVGHSLAGVMLGGVAGRLGSDLVERVIYVASCVPSQGQSVLDVLRFPLNLVVKRIIDRSPVISVVPPWIVRALFCNDVSASQRARIMANVHAESGCLLACKVSVGIPTWARATWILTERDRALPPRTQRRFIAALGGVDRVFAIDAGHEVMLTHPDQLAAALIDLAA